MTLTKKEDSGIRKRMHYIHSLENWFWKKLWYCHKTDYVMNERSMVILGRKILAASY
jgi:hypothetical protein